MRESIVEASKQLRNNESPRKKIEMIEKTFGYDVIDDRNYIDVEPIKQSNFDFSASTQPSSVALIPVLAKIQSFILNLDYFKLTSNMAHGLGEALSNIVP